MTAGDLVTLAVRDNARWCGLFTRTHGATGRTDGDAWTSPTRTPPGYPDAVTLRPGVDAAAVLACIDTATPGCSVKDSYADLDLSAHGFRELFAATWIGHPGDDAAASPAGSTPWHRLTEPDELHAWEAAWGHDGPEPFFRPELLRAPGVSMLAARDGPDVAGGAILTRWDALAVGVSNVFSTHGDHAGAWAGILAWAAVHHAGLPLVGYEVGDDLAAARDAGFGALGPLRVWLAVDADGGSA